MIRFVLTAAALTVSGAALAKLPPLDDAAQAKAAETKARAAWQSKVAAYKLCIVQNSIAAKFGRAGGAAASTAAAAPAAPAAATAEAAAAPTGPVNGTPVSVSAALPLPPCVDAGPFAYHPPSQTPLETSGAHSPAATAANPPSVRPESAEMAPSKAGAAKKP